MPCPTFTRQLSSFHALTVQLSTFDDTAQERLDTTPKTVYTGYMAIR